MKMYLTRHLFPRDILVFHNFCTETLIPQRFSQDVRISNDNLLWITKTREHSRISSSILSKHLENSSCQALHPGSQSTGFWGLIPCNATLSNWNTRPKFHLQRDPQARHCYLGGENPTITNKKTNRKAPPTNKTPTCMQRSCLKCCIAIVRFFQKTKSSLSSFFCGFTDDDSVLKLCSFHIRFH